VVRSISDPAGLSSGNRRRLRRWWSGPAAALLLCAVGHSATGAEPRELENIRVEGTRISGLDEDESRRAGFVTVIEAEEFDTRATDVAELLEKSVGVSVRRFGGAGDPATASIRGSSSEQVTVLLDGVPLNRARSGVVDLSNVPLRIVRRIEVYRSFTPLRYRSAAIGGVINIVTRSAGEEPVTEAAVTYGAFNGYELNGIHAGGAGTAKFLVAGNLAGSDGDFEFRDDNGTRFERSDDETTNRENNDFDSRELYTSAEFAVSKNWTLEAFGELFDKDEGVPGISSNQSSNARLDTRRGMVNMRASADRLGVDGLSGWLRLFAVTEESHFRDPLGEIGVGRQNSVDNNRALGAEAYTDYFLGDSHVLSALASLQTERYDNEDQLAGTTSRNQDRTIYQFGIEDQVFLWNDRLTLEPQISQVWIDNDFGGPVDSSGREASGEDDDFLSYKLGGRLELGGGWALKANVGRAWRYPTLTELFGDRGTVTGNPRLDAERSDKWDLGFSFASSGSATGRLGIDRISFEAAWFQSDARDLILFEQNSQRTVRPVNISEAETRGVEVAAGATLFGHVDLTANYTWIDSENRSGIPFLRGNQLPGVPEQELFVRADIYNDRFRAWYEFVGADDNFLDQANFEKVKDRSVHNAGVSATLRDSLILTFELKNITDERISDVLGFPLPGRAWFGRAVLKL
jgi:iron complex outermembrane receptor protein